MFHSLRPTNEAGTGGRNLIRDIKHCLTKASISFLIETLLSNPGKELGAHTASDKALIHCLTVGWVPQRPPWGYQEDRGNMESQQCASSHGLGNNRNGIINYVTNPQAPLSMRWQNCALQPGTLGGTCQGGLAVTLQGSRGWAKEQRPIPAVVGVPQAAERPRLPVVVLRQTQKDINHLLLNIPVLIAWHCIYPALCQEPKPPSGRPERLIWTPLNRWELHKWERQE